MSECYQGSAEHPDHLSVGAVLVDGEGNVFCHHFVESPMPAYAGLKDFYVLMRESVEQGETLEQAVHRGLAEEFGAKGDIVTYVGSRKTTYTLPKSGTAVRKTTLYFLVRMTEFDPSSRKADDEEKDSIIERLAPDELVRKAAEQRSRLGYDDLDESEIVERAIGYFRSRSGR